MSFDEIKSDAIMKYNNICERLKKDGKSFHGKFSSAVSPFTSVENPDKAKIVALTSELQQAQRLLKAYASATITASDASKSKGSGQKPNIEAWRMKKSFGDKTERDGKVWYWCPHHKYENFYDGLYVTHPPEKHEEWQDRQDKMKGRGKYANNSSEAASHNDVKLVLSDSVKQALVTDHGFTALQLEQLQRSQGN